MKSWHARWMVLVLIAAVTGMLSACAAREELPARAAQCYWLSNQGEGWVSRPDLSEPELCFEMDSCSGGVGLSGGGCYKWAIDADAPAAPWADLGFLPLAREAPEQAASGAACYLQRGVDGTDWVLMSGEREATCFARDACSGGLGTEDGQCLKWAMSAEAPALPWSPALTHPQLARDVRPPRDIYAGSYEMTSDCPEQGCSYGPARFAANTALYARQDTRSRLVATIPGAECVMKTGADALLSAPRRGVVLETAGPFTAGDVIYYTNYDGEGMSTVWRRGEYLSFEDQVVVRWDERPNDPREGYWVEVTRTNGQTGWVRDPEISERDCEFQAR